LGPEEHLLDPKFSFVVLIKLIDGNGRKKYNTTECEKVADGVNPPLQHHQLNHDEKGELNHDEEGEPHCS
jgi:hypothetical protein